MPRIPVIDRFRGDNDKVFRRGYQCLKLRWTHLVSADHEKRETVLCCLEKANFSTATTAIVANNDLTYNELRQVLKPRRLFGR